uniref:EF-hand domain-containing protein n=2 Tax=Panagrolaimus sp. JU765 TaxID=591449 RepID=A0AC34QH62_9BILA
MSLDLESNSETAEMDNRYLSPPQLDDDGWTKIIEFEQAKKIKETTVPSIVIEPPQPTPKSSKLKKQNSIQSLESRLVPKRMIRRVKVGVMPDESAATTPHNHLSSNRSNTRHEHSNSVGNIFHGQFLHKDGHHSLDELLTKFSKDELDEYHQLFSMFDTDGSGAIGSDELKEAIKSFGLQVNDSEIDRLIQEVDEDGNGEIDFAEFCDCMKKSQNLVKSTNEEIIRQCFEVFDQDKNGMITENEFKYVAKEIGEFSDELAEHVFHELDISSNGYLSPDQFAAIVEDYLLSDHYRY